MTESQPLSTENNWPAAFREAMTTSKRHLAIGMSEPVEVPPINQKLLAESIDISYDESPLDLTTFKETATKALDFAIQNTPLYSGITAKEFYESNRKDISIAEQSTREFIDILSTIVNGNIQELNLHESIANSLSKIKNQPSSKDIRRGVERGILTAKQCDACEQVDPIIGAQFHISSAIMNRLYGDSTFTEFWNVTYKHVIADINNPPTVGMVDLLFVIIRDNKERFPTLDKFCGSKLKLEGFEGTYYDMVDSPQYPTPDNQTGGNE